MGRVCNGAYWKLAALVAASSLILMAQSERGTIRGTVQDATGAVVPDATVTAINVGTGVGTRTVTTEAGNYNIPQLPPGRYTVQAEKEGFRKLIRENVVVEVSGIVGLDLRLDVGAVADRDRKSTRLNSSH